MKNFVILFMFLVVTGLPATRVIDFTGNWGQYPLFNMLNEGPSGVEIIFSMHQLVIEDVEVDGMPMQVYGVPTIFIPEPGVPNLNAICRYVAVPEGADARIEIISNRSEVYHNIDVAPAPTILREDDDSPLVYKKNMDIYGHDAYWPSAPVRITEPKEIRGVDVVVVGVMPFQYNPVRKELIVYKDIHFRINFIGGNGHFGVDRLRSRFWEPILQGNLLNYKSLPKIDFYSPQRLNAREGYEYIIIVPDDSIFIAWADTIKHWRKLPGISTEVFTLSQIGGSDSATIKNFLVNAYNTWNPAPVAFLLLSDYPSSGRVYGITSPGSGDDNWYADMNGDNLPDMHHGRICAQTDSQLNIMINKFLGYERNPYTTPNFYDNPLLATWWQTDRWFQLCSEVIRGFLINSLGKNPTRQYELYAGTPVPGCLWSNRQGTRPTVQYWYNLGWLPDTLNPYDAAWWNNGSPGGINTAINAGTFIFNLRAATYDTSYLSGLINDKFPFAFTLRSSDGNFASINRCFVEAFMRMNYGALGCNGATGVVYSFVNDVYNWGIYDGLWPQFDPGYPNFDMTGYPNLRPCMAMTHGKYYLEASWMPDSAGAGAYREYIYHLFHHHGDCFTTFYSEMPESLTVNHASVLLAGATYFTVQANDSSVIALTVNGEIIGVAEGTGAPLNIPIQPQSPGNIMKVTVTKADYYRYEKDVYVIGGPEGIVPGTVIINDSIGGNGNGVVEPGETIHYGVYAKNIGLDTACSVYGLLSTTDSYISISIDSSWYGNIPPGDSSLSDPFYCFTVAPDCPNNHTIVFLLAFHDTSNTYNSYPHVIVYAPVLVFVDDTILGGYNNGILDPGETAELVVTIRNDGGGVANNVIGVLTENSPYIMVNDANGSFGTINPGDTANNNADPFVVTCDSDAPIGDSVLFQLALTSGVYVDTIQFYVGIGCLLPTDTGYYYVYWSGCPYPNVAPVYSWFAIDTTQTQHQGTSLNPNDDQTFVVNLPFAFKYYGAHYTQISICSNGWLAMDATTSTDYSNTGIPNSDGPPAMVAGLWDDLNPNYLGEPGDVYYYFNASRHQFVVEWFRVPHYGNPALMETFEIILNDPEYYPTPTGDGEIIVQYLNAMLEPDNTVGIENSAQNVGVEYYYDGNYNPWAVPIQAEFALKYTTAGYYWGIAETEHSSQIIGPLLMVYPNPFHELLNLKFQVPRTKSQIRDKSAIRNSQSEMSLRIYDVSGRLVRQWDYKSIGQSGKITWDASDDSGHKLPSGVYFVRLESESFKKVEKVILLR